MYYNRFMTVTKRELNQNTAAVLSLVDDGRDVVITERGHPKWRITSFRGARTGLDRLAAAGVYTPPAETPAPWAQHSKGREYSSDEVAALLAEEREERV